MLMIVAHHYVVNSGLTVADGLIFQNPESPKTVFLLLFGAWGKAGINCFMMITGYFMCTSSISLRKFVKLLAQIYLYNLLLYTIFFLSGDETLNASRLIKVILPFWGFNDGFTSCFIIFYLTIPFWNILVHNMNKKQHALLLILLLGCYTILGSIPTFKVTFNYITWFGIIFLIASYIRLYSSPLLERCRLWGWFTLLVFVMSLTSVAVLHLKLHAGFYFMSDCNKFFAVAFAVCSFLCFKNMSIGYSKIINAFGAGTFGVLLIHANSDTMRTWLWKDLVDVIGYYQMLTTGELILYSVVVVLAVFAICNMIDQLRIITLEKWFFKWYDNKFSFKTDKFINRIIQN